MIKDKEELKEFIKNKTDIEFIPIGANSSVILTLNLAHGLDYDHTRIFREKKSEIEKILLLDANPNVRDSGFGVEWSVDLNLTDAKLEKIFNLITE